MLKRPCFKCLQKISHFCWAPWFPFWFSPGLRVGDQVLLHVQLALDHPLQGLPQNRRLRALGVRMARAQPRLASRLSSAVLGKKMGNPFLGLDHFRGAATPPQKKRNKTGATEEVSRLRPSCRRKILSGGIIIFHQTDFFGGWGEVVSWKKGFYHTVGGRNPFAPL